jgi:methylated-DNA-[protein]-cysteine S-methyltransferase
MFELSLLPSPIGPLTVAARDGRLCALAFGDAEEAVAVRIRRKDPAAALRRSPDAGGFAGVLEAYFAGDVHALGRVEVMMDGTPFQQAVWHAVRAIPPGRTASYADIAQAIAMPAAVRAVGAANGANPVALVVPCHRVIGRTGSLTGYGGGLDRKRWLLEHEGVLLRI